MRVSTHAEPFLQYLLLYLSPASHRWIMSYAWPGDMRRPAKPWSAKWHSSRLFMGLFFMQNLLHKSSYAGHGPLCVRPWVPARTLHRRWFPVKVLRNTWNRTEQSRSRTERNEQIQHGTRSLPLHCASHRIASHRLASPGMINVA